MTSAPGQSAQVVAALFVRRDSIYKRLGVDAWDIDRDARRYDGPGPVVAHPPCRTWGRYRREADAGSEEHRCGLVAVELVRRFGGVLEHPRCSSLWAAAGLPEHGVDPWGGFTVAVNQSWFGHRAEKATWLYLCGVSSLPSWSVDLSIPVDAVQHMGRAAREATPESFARFLVEVASRARRPVHLASPPASVSAPGQSAGVGQSTAAGVVQLTGRTVHLAFSGEGAAL
jgi:hypothetical protein